MVMALVQENAVGALVDDPKWAVVDNTIAEWANFMAWHIKCFDPLCLEGLW